MLLNLFFLIGAGIHVTRKDSTKSSTTTDAADSKNLLREEKPNGISFVDKIVLKREFATLYILLD